MKKLLLFSFIILFFSCQSNYDGMYEEPVDEDPDPPEQYSYFGLVAYFPFDGDVNDYCDTSNYCIDLSDSTYVNGVSGQAKDFNGSSDMLRLYRTLHSGYGLTFSFWIKSRGVLAGQQNGIVIGKYDSSVMGRCFVVLTQESDYYDNPSLRGIFYPSGSSSRYSDGIYSNIFSAADLPIGKDSSDYTAYEPMRLPLNEWTHCVINVSDSTLEAWINGVLTVSTERFFDIYNDISLYNNSTTQTYIGNLPHMGQGSNNHFNGALDELRVYNRPLTPEEINSLYLYPDGSDLVE